MYRNCVATYYYKNLEVDVYGCSDKLTKNDYEFFELHIKDECVSDGHLLEEIPTWMAVKEFLIIIGGEKYELVM